MRRTSVVSLTNKQKTRILYDPFQQPPTRSVLRPFIVSMWWLPLRVCNRVLMWQSAPQSISVRLTNTQMMCVFATTTSGVLAQHGFSICTRLTSGGNVNLVARRSPWHFWRLSPTFGQCVHDACVASGRIGDYANGFNGMGYFS